MGDAARVRAQHKRDCVREARFVPLPPREGHSAGGREARANGGVCASGGGKLVEFRASVQMDALVEAGDEQDVPGLADVQAGPEGGVVVSRLVEYVEDEFGGYAVGEIWREGVYISALHLVRSWRYGLLVVLQGCAGREVVGDEYKMVIFTEVCEAAVYVELIGSRLDALKRRC